MKKTKVLSLIRPKNKELDIKTMKFMLSTIINQVQSTNLYTEDQGILADYNQLQYAINTIHTYLYDKNNSNLTEKDAQIMAAYLVEKTKQLKSVIDKIAITNNK